MVKKRNYKTLDKIVEREKKKIINTFNNKHKLINTIKIPSEVDKKIIQLYRSWDVFLGLISLASGIDTNGEVKDWIKKKIWGIDYPHIYLNDSILHNFNINYTNLGYYLHLLEFFQYEDHHPFIYLIDVRALIIYEYLTEKPANLEYLITNNIEIGTDEFIRKCIAKERKIKKQIKIYRMQAP